MTNSSSSLWILWKNVFQKGKLEAISQFEQLSIQAKSDTVRSICRYCRARFKSQRVLTEHLNLDRCAVQRSQRRQQQPDHIANQQQQQPQPQMPPQLLAMIQPQQIGWITEFLARSSLGRASYPESDAANLSIGDHNSTSISAAVDGDRVNGEEATRTAADQ